MSNIERLDEIQERADKAEDGPWLWEDGQDGPRQVWMNGPDERVLRCATFWGPEPADAEFIAHARTDVPALVAALRAVLDVCARSEIGAYPEPKHDEYLPGQIDTAKRVRDAIAAVLCN